MQPTHDTSNQPVKAEKNPVVFWMKNQIAVTFLLDHKPAGNGGPVPAKQPIIDMVLFQKLEEFLHNPNSNPSPVGLRSFKPNEVPRIPGGKYPGDDSPGLNNPRAKYVFPASQGQQIVLTAFFQITDPLDPNTDPQEDHTIRIVNLINEKASTHEGILEISASGVLKISAMPNWVGGGTADVGHGCPITPPIPVDPSDVCSTSSGYHPITLTQPPPEFAYLQETKGDGVTVLVLDTLPQPEDIKAALIRLNASAPGANDLLKDMATDLKELNQLVLPLPAVPSSAAPPAINLFYQTLPSILDEQNNLHQPRTGKDIRGDVVGFPMADHGLSVAGIIRSIAPAANIVCARVLNDYGAGDVHTLIALLELITDQLLLQRGGQDPQTFNPRLIINMSLVVSPYDSQLGCLGVEPVSSDVREGLKTALQALAGLNVIMVAAAGNDSDPREPDPTVTDMMCMPDPPKKGTHYGPRPPAAFADTIRQIISVGAIDGIDPAPYSNYPGKNGVATYGGGLPVRDPHLRQGHTLAQSPIDGLRSVYTSQFYPALYRRDDRAPDEPAEVRYPEFDAPDARAWAYWSGTSFATPIITGFVACMLPTILPTNVGQQVINLAGGNTITWVLDDGTEVSSPVISAQQC